MKLVEGMSHARDGCVKTSKYPTSKSSKWPVLQFSSPQVDRSWQIVSTCHASIISGIYCTFDDVVYM